MKFKIEVRDGDYVCAPWPFNNEFKQDQKCKLTIDVGILSHNSL